MVPGSSSLLLAALAAFVTCIACGSDDASDAGGAGSGGGSSTGGALGTGGNSGLGGSAAGGSLSSTAQVRFRYEAEWKDHLGACASVSDYRIKFGAIPVPVTATIDVTTPDWLGEYVQVDGRTYKDGDVLHIFSCNQSQTSKSTKQLYGRFGTDLGFEPAKRYTVTLGGTVATLAEDL